VRIDICNAQKLFRLDLKAVRLLTTRLMNLAMRKSPISKPSEVSIVLTDNKEMSKLNLRHLGRSGPTDVLAFRLEPIPGEPPAVTVEIVVNVEMAAIRRPPCRSPARTSRELALYLAHGCDHSAGNDDATARERQQMRRRELRWLKRSDIAPLVNRLIRT